MKVLVQRSLNSSVSVADKKVGSIEYGIVIFVGFAYNDSETIIDHMVKKILNLRIFDDDEGIMNKSLLDVKGSILSISQFTLYADTKKGNRPSYMKALKSDKAEPLYDLFNKKLRQFVNVETGVFGADMKVNIVNDGPITIMLESRNDDDKE